MGVLKYKGYSGSVEYSEEDNLLYGKVLGMDCVGISYHGSSVEELRKDFEEAVDFYLEDCAEEGTEPQKPYSGKLNLRMTSQVHERVAETAREMGCSINDCINAFVRDGLQRYAAAH